MIERRSFLSGIIAACAAPAIIRTAGLIMPIRPPLVDNPFGASMGLRMGDIVTITWTPRGEVSQWRVLWSAVGDPNSWGPT